MTPKTDGVTYATYPSLISASDQAAGTFTSAANAATSGILSYGLTLSSGPIAAKGKALATLDKTGKVTVKVQIAFTGPDGTKQKATTTVTLVKK